MVEGWGSVCLASVFTVETRSFWAPGHRTWKTLSSPVFSADDSRLWWTRRLLTWLLMCWTARTHYAAESLSWYSRERLKQAWTPLSFQSRLMTPASSAVMKPSSAEPASTNSCRASSWERSRGGVNIINQPSQSLHHHCDSHELSS